MEEAFAKVEDLVGHVKEYVNNRVESAKLNMAEKSIQYFCKVYCRNGSTGPLPFFYRLP
jgi:hypothetical protein